MRKCTLEILFTLRLPTPIISLFLTLLCYRCNIEWCSRNHDEANSDSDSDDVFSYWFSAIDDIEMEEDGEPERENLPM
jgi:hypothetical protein